MLSQKEKESEVIELLEEGWTIHAIAKEVSISFSDMGSTKRKLIVKRRNERNLHQLRHRHSS